MVGFAEQGRRASRRGGRSTHPCMGPCCQEAISSLSANAWAFLRAERLRSPCTFFVQFLCSTETVSPSRPQIVPSAARSRSQGWPAGPPPSGGLALTAASTALALSVGTTAREIRMARRDCLDWAVNKHAASAASPCIRSGAGPGAKIPHARARSRPSKDGTHLQETVCLHPGWVRSHVCPGSRRPRCSRPIAISYTAGRPSTAPVGTTPVSR